jgi:glycyl-tRNA synthetase
LIIALGYQYNTDIVLSSIFKIFTYIKHSQAKNQFMPTQPTLKNITALAKRRGFVYPTSEIYGGLANSYDYGPLGAQLMKTIKDLWWKTFIEDRDDMYAVDSQILLHPQTWVASGHVESFTDPLVEDKVTHERFRADHLISNWIEQQNNHQYQDLNINEMTTHEMAEFIQEHQITSPSGNPITPPKDFNIMFKTAIGAVAGEKSTAYLRGETAQGIFSNFKQVLDSTRARLPFGIGQIGKSFRNEITKGQFIFRLIEFEQAEIEYFFNPEQHEWKELFENWQDKMWQFVTKTLGINQENLNWRRHTDQERSHYSQETYDLDYKFPFGWDELWGIAYRGDYDLKQHMKYSGESLEYIDPHTQEKIIPHVVEPALGLNRALLMVLSDAYRQDKKGRLFLDFKPSIAPYQVAVFPLLKNKPQLIEKARTVYQNLKPHFRTIYDERDNIGQRYLSQDEIGTPFCVTIDFDTLENGTVTVRHRNTTKQDRIKIDQLADYLNDMINSNS